MSTEHKLVLSKWVWIGLPLFIFIFPFLIKSFSEESYRKYIMGESGLYEVSTVIFLAVASVVAILTFRLLRCKTSFKLLKCWVLLFAFATFVFLGEESSWGQHYLGWKSPKIFKKNNLLANKQHETNLHNSKNQYIRFLFKDFPRLSLEIVIIVFGIIGPLVLSTRLVKLNNKTTYLWLIGDLNGLLSAILALTITVPERIISLEMNRLYTEVKQIGISTSYGFWVHNNESKESMMALFLMIYILSIYLKCKNALSLVKNENYINEFNKTEYEKNKSIK